MKLDQEEVNSYHQRQFFDEPKARNLDGATIFFAVAGALIFCWFLKGFYEEWQVRRAMAIFSAQMTNMEMQTKNELRKMQIKTETYKAENEERARAQAQQKEQLRIQKYHEELEQQAMLQAQIAEKNAKEIARGSFYKPIDGCESKNPDRDLIKCGNDYAQANKRFEDNWAKKLALNNN